MFINGCVLYHSFLFCNELKNRLFILLNIDMNNIAIIKKSRTFAVTFVNIL